MVTGCYHGQAQFWDAQTGRPAGPLPRRGGPVWDLDFSPDGLLLLADPPPGGAGSRCCEIATGLAVPLALPTGGVPGDARDVPIRSAAFSPVGGRVLSVAGDGLVGLWDLEPDPRPVESLVRLAEILSEQEIDATGAPVPMDPQEWRSYWEGGRSGGGSIVSRAP